MAEPHVLTALQDKYRRIKGQIDALDSQAGQLRIDLDRIEHVIRLFQQDWRDDTNVIVPRKPSRWQRRGEGIQTMLAVLRDAREPMTAREIVLAVYGRLGHPTPCQDKIRTQISIFSAQLRRHSGRGVMLIDGYPKRWVIERR
jgi:hypothetical protein